MWHEANDAQRTLGSHIAPDGSFVQQFEVLQGKLSDWQQCLRNLKSTNFQTKWLSFRTVFLKKILYPLIGHNCTSHDLHSIQQTVDKEVLHVLGLNEHFPRTVLHAPLLYGGIECGTIHSQHVIEKLILFLHHVRENRQMCETMQASMSITQIECGSSFPFFELVADQWAHLVTPTWISHLWQECQPKGISVKFYTDFFWVPKPVREHDTCIMDIAHQMYSGQQLLQINMCRLALQVTYLSDIASVDGRRILLAYYNGNEHRESGRRTRLNWPPVGKLPAQWWKIWQDFFISLVWHSFEDSKTVGGLVC
jgi:hypothetical protein